MKVLQQAFVYVLCFMYFFVHGHIFILDEDEDGVGLEPTFCLFSKTIIIFSSSPSFCEYYTLHKNVEFSSSYHCPHKNGKSARVLLQRNLTCWIQTGGNTHLPVYSIDLLWRKLQPFMPDIFYILYISLSRYEQMWRIFSSISFLA